jgi:hypothetical protein
MLAVQVQYQDYKERQRHNLATEAMEQQDVNTRKQLAAETVKHNRETENISWFSAKSQNAHFERADAINWFNAQEQQRHNIAGESISWFNAKELARHNLVTEDQGQQAINETIKHNRATESIGRANIALGYANLAEQHRHAKVTEAQGARALRNTERDIANRERQTSIAGYNATTNRSEVSSRIKVNQAQIDKFNSDISLNREYEQTQDAVRFNTYAQGWNNITGGISNIGRVTSGMTMQWATALSPE